jgi:murein DD-endopeptidase MepM/ murein hydrolase activator NlpD
LSLSRSTARALCAAVAALLALAAITAITSRPGVAHAASVGQLQQQIGAGQGRINGLSGAVGADTARLGQLNGSIVSLQGRIGRIQAQLIAERTKLLTLRGELDRARTRLAQLVAFQAKAEAALSRQLVNSYESDRPDVMTVVLEARGFQDLLERLQFAARIKRQDVQIVKQVRSARSAVAEQATRLGGLEARQQTITGQVLGQRNILARAKLALVTQQLTVAQSRQAKATELAAARAQVGRLQNQLAKIQIAQAAAANPGSAVGAAQISSGGGFTFPLPKGAASPPGSWTEDQGVDIAASGNTPLLAVCSGTIVLHGIGGFGPDAPVLHCDSGPYVYYGHAGPANALPIGTHVGSGQVISSVGPGIVGISTGPHLEIGFSDSSGTPVGAGTAGQMMAQLRASYGG